MIVKIVFDTNIYISAFAIPGGNAEKAYLHAIDGDFTLFTSIAILTEVAQKLDEKFGWEKQKIVPINCLLLVSFLIIFSLIFIFPRECKDKDVYV